VTQSDTDADDADDADDMQFPVTQLPCGRVASGYNGMPSNCPNDELPWGKKSSSGHDTDTTEIRHR